MIVRSTHLAESADMDLRRRRSRLQADHLTRRAEVLKAPERRLIHDLFDAGRACSQIAAELGRDARTVRREVRGITRRLLDPRFDFVLARSERWRPTRRRVAQSVYIHGNGLRETARELGLSLYCVRRHRDAIEALFEAEAGHAATA
ncbi:MAG: helix-turn-helix domain-containing protein [Planctomycetota bacterium]